MNEHDWTTDDLLFDACEGVTRHNNEYFNELFPSFAYLQ
jgi:hypothetical protein